MIIVFTGDGKGKTSAAFGTVLRALNNNEKVSLIQFLKYGNSSEVSILKDFISKNKNLSNTFSIQCFGKKQLTDPKSLKKIDYKQANKGLEAVREEIERRPFLIVLDEVIVALNFGLLKRVDIFSIMKKCKEYGIHLILTGRKASQSIIKEADLVTEMRNIKHPYDAEKEAIRGIDF